MSRRWFVLLIRQVELFIGMFKPKSERVENLGKKFARQIQFLENILQDNVGIYIDYANVRPWAVKLQWNIDLHRLKVFLSSFDNIKIIKFFDGTLDGDKKTEKAKEERERIFKQGFVTKPVKIMKQFIDYTSIKSNSSDLLEKFIRKCLLREYKLEAVEYLNERFKEMNQNGKYYIEDRKCNFDVEIGTAMMLDFERQTIDTFVLWSGDSDFHDPIDKLLSAGKKVILFATTRKVSAELNSLQTKGLFIFDIQKIREFICWKSQI